MKKKKWNRLFSVLFVMVTVISLLSGCGRKSAEKEDAETITVYLWSTQLLSVYQTVVTKRLQNTTVFVFFSGINWTFLNRIVILKICI